MNCRNAFIFVIFFPQQFIFSCRQIYAACAGGEVAKSLFLFSAADYIPFRFEFLLSSDDGAARSKRIVRLLAGTFFCFFSTWKNFRRWVFTWSSEGRRFIFMSCGDYLLQCFKTLSTITNFPETQCFKSQQTFPCRVMQMSNLSSHRNGKSSRKQLKDVHGIIIASHYSRHSHLLHHLTELDVTETFPFFHSNPFPTVCCARRFREWKGSPRAGPWSESNGKVFPFMDIVLQFKSEKMMENWYRKP